MDNIFYRLNDNKWLQAIKRGFLKIQSIVIIGCLTTIIINLPIKVYQEFMVNLFGAEWQNLFSVIQRYTLGIITIPLVIASSYSLADIKMTMEKKSNHKPIISAIISFVIIILLVSDLNIIHISSLGAGGMALGVLIALFATEMFLYFNSVFYKERKNIDYSNDSVLNESIDSILPATLTIIIFFAIRMAVLSIGNGNVFEVWNQMFNSIILFFNRFIPTVFIYVFGIHIFWFLGIHGSNIFDIVNISLFDKNIEANITAVANGIEATEIFTKQFFDIFVSIGGGGATLCLIIAVLITKANNNNKNIAKISILPGIFNINEIMIFGFPIIFNPVYLIPFILIPVIFTFTSWLAMTIGIVPVTINETNWITPIFFNAYLATESIGAVILQIFNICIGVLIYIPFVKLSNKVSIKESKVTFEKLKDEVFSHEDVQKYITVKSDSIGAMARGLGNDLIYDLNNNKSLYLEYQPQVNKYNKIIGVEALLRWKHDILGSIPPNIIITIAQEINIIDHIGIWVIDKACSQLNTWNKLGIDNIEMSINISTLQLKNEKFASNVKEIIEKYNVDSSKVKLEITENLAISNDSITDKQLRELDKTGVKLAIDDFGQGYNPILYIQKYNVEIIKLDGSLIKNIVNDEISRNIVKSMHSLCDVSNITMIAEFVETIEQKEILDTLENCIYQGYLFSKPLGSEECLKYIVNHQ